LQVFAGDLDEVRSFMRISHGNKDHLTLASRTMWAIFKCNKVTKPFQLQGLANHPSIMGTYVSFLVDNSKIGKAEKLQKKVNQLKEDVKTLTSEIKAAKSRASSTDTKADKAMVSADKAPAKKG